MGSILGALAVVGVIAFSQPSTPLLAEVRFNSMDCRHLVMILEVCSGPAHISFLYHGVGCVLTTYRAPRPWRWQASVVQES